MLLHSVYSGKFLNIDLRSFESDIETVGLCRVFFSFLFMAILKHLPYNLQSDPISIFKINK